MMDDRTGVKAAKVCGAFVYTFLLALLLSVLFDFYYDLNDDTMIKDIVSGAYTGQPSGYCIQMLYPLAWCLALFYKAIPTIPWYGLFLCLCQFGVVSLAAARLLLSAQRARAGFVAAVVLTVLAFGVFLREFVVIQYSVTSGICMTGAVFLFLTTPPIDKPAVFFRRNLLPLVLVVLSFMIRTEVCIMLVPFLLLAGMAKWCGENKIFTAVNFRKYLTLIATAVLCIVAVYSLDMVAYRGSEWTNFRDFFDARTKLYDFYGLPAYENHQEFYDSIGLSRESYTLLENYNFALDESIDTWRLEAIVAYQEELARPAGGENGLHNTFGFVSKNDLRGALWLYRNQVLEDFRAVKNLVLRCATASWEEPAGRIPVSMAVIGAYLLYFVTGVVMTRGRMRGIAILRILCLFAVRSILWMYLFMVDRVLDRVTIPLLMMELSMLLGFWRCDCPQRVSSREPKAARSAAPLLCIAGAIAIAAVFAVNLQNVQYEYSKRAAADERWNAMMDYCRKNGNNYYVIDVYSATSYQNAPYSEKIFTDVDNAYKNFELCGGWAAKSPLAKQKLEQYRFRDVQSALCASRTGGQAKAYFVVHVDKDLDWLVQYYEKRGITIELECIDQIQTNTAERAFDVYELAKK
ncbi:MAG: hypothetical protein K2K74_06735 [Lachnospiraceae bacterium]|nr:hypothetical protein [Lachnospiraceae bacterium]